jgi:hypothetical protein
MAQDPAPAIKVGMTNLPSLPNREAEGVALTRALVGHPRMGLAPAEREPAMKTAAREGVTAPRAGAEGAARIIRKREWGTVTGYVGAKRLHIPVFN